ncbi:MAG: ABC transporter permease [Nitrospirae bacterium]|nr:MAG: ABC transporter permease [Nitrospirota bacterium]
MSLPYSFKSACRSIAREKWINLLSTLTVGSSLFIITLTSFFLYNVELVASRIPERFSMVVYLKKELSKEETDAVINTIKQRQDVMGITYLSREDAMNELKQALKDSGNILEGLDENPLAASIELKLKRDFISTTGTKQIAESIKAVNGVDDVFYGEKIAEAIYRLRRSLENISIIIFLTISAGVVFVMYSTVKILFYRKKNEIDILKLLGATGGFIRGPFLIEGGLIGLSGGLLGLCMALMFYFALTYRLSRVIPMLKTLVFPVEILVALPVIGIILGIIGAAIAIGRIRL